jgi:glutamyl-tRNA synthetase
VRPCAWRFDGGAVRVAFDDLVAGPQGAIVDDFVVWREGLGGAQTAAYNLAVVVDDADQGVGEVVRGDDLLETTPRQILLAGALDVPVPRYAHVPLVLWRDGRRLAKRHPPAGTPATLPERLARGERVEELVGWMASSAGLAPAGSAISASELLAHFSATKLTREPVLLDADA